MSFDPDAVETVAFDSYSTIVDVTAVTEPLSEYVNSPETVAKLWRERSLGYAMVGNAIEEYDSFYAMNRHALRWALETTGTELDESEREDVLSAYQGLPVFDDVHDGMARLRDAGYDRYVVSNGSEDMLESMVDHGGLEDHVTETISADEVQQFKPEAEFYRHAADRIGRPPEEICYVAAGWWDVPGAKHVGMQSVWINRQGTLWGPYEMDPDLTIDAFGELADELDA